MDYLPLELLELIASFLSESDATALALTCKLASKIPRIYTPIQSFIINSRLDLIKWLNITISDDDYYALGSVGCIPIIEYVYDIE